MSAEKQQDPSINPTCDLFGEPPLLKGEDKERYLRLLAAIEHQVDPKTIFDKMRVRDLTDKYWEQQRCKQSCTSLVEGAYIEALASLLRPFIEPTLSIGEDVATRMARSYYSGEAKPDEMEEMELRLAQYGITAEQIRAKAMQLCGAGVVMFNRMEANCASSLRSLQKENDRRYAVDAKAREIRRLKIDGGFPMATEKQVAANRANAKRSTGPKTMAGRLKSSRNAYRHGLSCELPFDPVTSAKASAIAHTLVGDGAGEEELASAAEFARAQLKLLRIRSVRNELMANIELHQGNMHELQRLAALDRYERYAQTRRRRASEKL